MIEEKVVAPQRIALLLPDPDPDPEQRLPRLRQCEQALETIVISQGHTTLHMKYTWFSNPTNLAIKTFIIRGT